MAKLHSNRSFMGNIALVVFLAFLVTLSIGIAPHQVQATDVSIKTMSGREIPLQ